MISFTLTAAEVFRASKSLFCSLIPDFEIQILKGEDTRITFDLRNLCRLGYKDQRVKSLAYILVYATSEDKQRLWHWMRDCFSSQAQSEMFAVYAADDGTFTPCKPLERALRLISKEKAVL
jgi:hypothetical protein